jgi:dihydrofolate reductase
VARLIYYALTSLDGYVADRAGNFDWAEPDEEVHQFVNDLVRPAGTFLFGRRMYEVLVAWETMQTEDQPEFIRDFAEIWREADKVVYSSSLEAPNSARTRIEREFDIGVVRRMKEEATRDLTIGGPTLAAEGLRAGLVDELYLFLSPILVGGGTAALPNDLRLPLRLMDERRFGNGTAFLRYATGQ